MCFQLRECRHELQVRRTVAGTGLMRVMLDAHPQIRCGAEPMITLDLLRARHSMPESKRERGIEAGVFPEAFDQAVAAFILKTVEKMGPPADYLCHKQPLTFIYLKYLAELFPKAKFIHMLRDGRAAVASSVDFEPSTKQLRQAIHTNSLGKWASTDYLAKNPFMRVAHEQIPLLRLLGYANAGIPPNYSKLPTTLPDLA
ncbi:protein-tyrosine sulfotransferase [Paragonimus westermani]|uniref:Protein-tyrosine sulfotransferase n=1 Tax=Paragonimus westermani TaxID=34504 RepID=A0A5J4NTV9_9TREM|nr:protein-tyrosine sulfotransferase [Paragonimus westermani]